MQCFENMVVITQSSIILALISVCYSNSAISYSTDQNVSLFKIRNSSEFSKTLRVQGKCLLIFQVKMANNSTENETQTYNSSVSEVELVQERNCTSNATNDQLDVVNDTNSAPNFTNETSKLSDITYQQNMETHLRISKRGSEDYNYDNESSYNESNWAKNDTSVEDYLNDIREFIFPKAWTWVLIFFHSAVFIIGLIGNALVCVSVYRNHTMRTVTNYFIVNLAIADFLVILLCLPPSVIWDVTMTWFLGIALCKIVLYLQTVSVTVSVLTLTFISVDRWYAICFPLKFKSTTGRAKMAIGIIWLLALIFDIPELVVYRIVPHKDHPIGIDTIYFTQCAPSWSVEADRNWMAVKMILLYAIPLIFMSVAYCQIIRVLWKSVNVPQHSLDISNGRYMNTFSMNTNTSTEGQLRSRRKAAKMLVAVVIMFAVCYFPVHLLNVLRVTISLSSSQTNIALFLISHWLCYANSAVNPIIYNFMSGKFRKEFRRAFEHCCQPSINNQRGYQLSNLHPKNTEKESGIGSRSQSRCSKRTLTEVRRLDTIERGLNENHRTPKRTEYCIDSRSMIENSDCRVTWEKE